MTTSISDIAPKLDGTDGIKQDFHKSKSHRGCDFRNFLNEMDIPGGVEARAAGRRQQKRNQTFSPASFEGYGAADEKFGKSDGLAPAQSAAEFFSPSKAGFSVN
ncbi:MAG TPA: hypothetical protein VMV89_07375 [Candidatus Paceibacterota bacterium]|nr:hypothetical protein [Candidatus Paceibacterota bacterium]